MGATKVPLRLFYGPSGQNRGSGARARSIAKTGLQELQAKHVAKQPIVMVTAYDVLTSRCAHTAGVDMILVGDSLGMVVYGEKVSCF